MYSAASNLKPCNLSLQANNLRSNPARYGVLLLYMLYHSREIFNSNLPTAHYGTNHADRDTEVEGCDAHACCKQHKTLITATRQFIRNHGFFNYAFLSILCAIIATFEGDP